MSSPRFSKVPTLVSRFGATFEVMLLALILAACAGNGRGSGGASPSPISPVAPLPMSSSNPDPIAKGTSDSGGQDWFVAPLPILKPALSPTQLVAEGVHYKIVHLRPCTDRESHPANPEYEPILFFPGPEFAAVKVQAKFNNLVCSFGVVERDPAKALQILVNNDDTNRDEVFQHVTIHSKTYGGPMAVGNFLITAKVADQVTIFGQGGMLNFDLKQHFWYDPERPGTDKMDLIYVPIEIQPSERGYYGNNPMGNWRIVLPVAYAPADLPLSAFSRALTATKEKRDQFDLAMLNPVGLPEGFPNGFGDATTKVAEIWTALERSCDDVVLRDQFYADYALPLKGSDLHGYTDLKIIADHFTFNFSPTIMADDLNRASYHASGHRTVFALPLLNPTWRVAADLLHELTHAVQNHEESSADESRFKNEMEAHLTERRYLKILSEKSEVLRLSIATHKSITAAGVPKVKFVASTVHPNELPLCDEILQSYHLDRNHISAATLKSSGCGDH